MKNKYIDEAVDIFRRQSVGYAKSERYYAGRHDLAFATDKFMTAFGSLFREFALNLCPAVCDAVRDKLRVTGFSIDSVDRGRPAREAGSSGLMTVNDEGTRLNKRRQADEAVRGPAADLRRIWNANRMRTRAGEVHKEAL